VHAMLPPGGQRFLVESDMVPNFYIFPCRDPLLTPRARAILPSPLAAAPGLPTSSTAQCARTMRPRATRPFRFRRPASGSGAGGACSGETAVWPCGTIQVAISNSGNTPAGVLDWTSRQRTPAGQVRSDSVTRARVQRHPLIMWSWFASLSNMDHD